MIELKNESLVFTFPEIHPKAYLKISFKRTLRIPDDENLYPLPPSLGNFPIEHVDDFPKNLPEKWIEHGGVMFPMYQSEAMWIDFESEFIPEHKTKYPFAVKIATGKINVITGEYWTDSLSKQPQDYLVVPGQPWIDGYCIEKGVIRQFVAMPLGDGYSAEAQITGQEGTGGLQIIVYPMKLESFVQRWPEIPAQDDEDMDTPTFYRVSRRPDMVLAPGGRMRQEIYKDEFDHSEWELSTCSRCFAHMANSQMWKKITGKYPPTTPPTAKEYNQSGLPWFDYYSDHIPLAGAEDFGALESISSLGKKKRQAPLRDNTSFSPKNILSLFKRRKRSNQVREWKNG